MPDISDSKVSAIWNVSWVKEVESLLCLAVSLLKKLSPRPFFIIPAVFAICANTEPSNKTASGNCTRGARRSKASYTALSSLFGVYSWPSVSV